MKLILACAVVVTGLLLIVFGTRAETHYCLQAENGDKTVVQCQNGTVTIVDNSDGKVVVCSTQPGDAPRCQVLPIKAVK